MEDDIKVFMPKSKFVTLNGNKYEIKKLGVKQIANLAIFLGSLEDNVRDIIKKGLTGDNNKDFLNLISKLTDEQLPELYGILLNSDDIEKMKKIDDGVEVSELLLATLETTDIERLIGNFSSAAEKIMILWQKIKSSAIPPSSSK